MKESLCNQIVPQLALTPEKKVDAEMRVKYYDGQSPLAVLGQVENASIHEEFPSPRLQDAQDELT